MSLSQKFVERVRKFSFLARHHFKVELFRYIYIVAFGKHVSELYWMVLMFVEPQRIASLEDFLPLLSHCAKNHISQVLEYHRKLKKTT